MPESRYRAFISYSQRDGKVAQRLHRWLEAYRVPKGIAANLVTRRRLGRFFRDDEEMPASSDLAATIRGAIDDAESLIVVCSPRAAQSKWVNAEIIHFRRTNRGRRIFAIVADGTPNSGDPATECFPPALRIVEFGEDGREMPIEPLAIDWRRESKTRLCARLAAGLLNTSFDNLWQREKRKRRVFAMQATALSALLAALVGVLTLQMVASQKIARGQERSVKLAKISETIGASEIEALSTLHDLLAESPQDPDVIDVAGTILSWARTPAETIASLPAPRLLSLGNRLLLHTGRENEFIGHSVPLRRIGFSGGRLLVIYENRLVVVDQSNGRLLGEVSSSARERLEEYQWEGLAFESRDGTALLTGMHYGVSNSQVWHEFAVLSPQGGLSMLTPMVHPAAGDDSYRARDVGRVFMSTDCTMLGILDANQKGVSEPERRKFLIALGSGARFGGTSDLMGGGLLELLPVRADDRLFWQVTIERSVAERGCKNPAFDTMRKFSLAGLGGPILGADIRFSPAPASAWTPSDVTVDAANDGGLDAEWASRSRAIVDNFCPDGGCPIVGKASNIQRFEPPTSGSMGWVRTSRPPAQDFVGALAGEFAARPLYTNHEQHNAGIESAWCRKDLSGKPLCLVARAGIEYRYDWSDIDVRSRSGRFVYYSNGKFPFDVFDVSSMRVATPTENGIVSRPGAAAFSDGPDDRLFVFTNGRLHALELDAKSGVFVDVSDSLAWSRRLIGVDDKNPVVSLLALPSGDLIASMQDGRVTRFDWRTARIAWTRAALGIGNIRSARRSPSADNMVLIGDNGIRVLRTRDGLLTSGVLVPPYFFDPRFELRRCLEDYISTPRLTDALTDVTLEDKGRLTLQCGAASFRWQAQPFRGNLMNRIGELVAQEPT